MKIAFYAPLKSPNHPVPSGDRLMARLLMMAITLARMGRSMKNLDTLGLLLCVSHLWA